MRQTLLETCIVVDCKKGEERERGEGGMEGEKERDTIFILQFPPELPPVKVRHSLLEANSVVVCKKMTSVRTCQKCLTSSLGNSRSGVWKYVFGLVVVGLAGSGQNQLSDSCLALGIISLEQ